MNRDHKLDLLDMPEMLGVLFDDVDHAQERIDIECYIFSSDEFGKDFAERMCKAKGRGVKTRALYDPLGSQKARRSSSRRCAARVSTSDPTGRCGRPWAAASSPRATTAASFSSTRSR
jgi:phosphatidylserine/phosphatidylglycerophosphate/cardiolipin synthase-like enzyme